MIGANHPFRQRTLNALDENGNEGCAACGRARSAHPAAERESGTSWIAVADGYEVLLEPRGDGSLRIFRHRFAGEREFGDFVDLGAPPLALNERTTL